MNAELNWIDYWNEKTRRINTIWDLKLVQIWSAVWMLIIVKLFPQIIQLSIWWFVGIGVLCIPRIFYVMFKKENCSAHN